MPTIEFIDFLCRSRDGYQERMHSRFRPKVVRLWTTCPQVSEVTPYDKENISLYSLLLDAERDGAGDAEIARIFCGGVPKHKMHDIVRSHLKRARWIAQNAFPWLPW